MWRTTLVPLLPERIGRALCAMSEPHARTVEEVRIRAGQPVQALGRGWESFFSEEGERPFSEAALIATAQECERMLSAFCMESLYAAEEPLRRGAIALPGGCRAGFCGRAVVENGRIARIASPAFFCIRIARQVKGAGKTVLPWMLREGRPLSTLILSPPGCGKTTLLRDLARMLSSGEGCFAQRVCVADERSELAGCFEGVPQCDLGPRTDVLEGCPKGEALELLLRAMSPDVLVCDEVGAVSDGQALCAGADGGAALLVSAHGSGIEAVRKRPVLRMLWKEGIFERFVVLSRENGPGTVEGVFDGNLNRMDRKEERHAFDDRDAAGGGLRADGAGERPAAPVPLRTAFGDAPDASDAFGGDPVWRGSSPGSGGADHGRQERRILSGVFRGAGAECSAAGSLAAGGTDRGAVWP